MLDSLYNASAGVLLCGDICYVGAEVRSVKPPIQYDIVKTNGCI
jgi:hypothetical protein